MPDENVNMAYPLVSSTRDALDFTFYVKEGAIPDDWHGYVFINTPNGSVNSALPYPQTTPDGKPNQEYGSPLLGGAGYIMKFDLNEKGAVRLQSDLLRPPSFYADEATKYGTHWHKILGFKNMGIARLSFVLGAGEQLGTAVVPVRFKPDNAQRLLATADLGRAYEFDADSLKIRAAIGRLKDYEAATPPSVKWLFKLIQGTAHPTFDPITQELFTVNYTKSVKTLLYASGILPLLQRKPRLLERLLEQSIDEWEGVKGRKLGFAAFLGFVEQRIANKKSKFWSLIRGLIDCFKKENKLIDEVYLLRFDNHSDYKRWRITDEAGQNIAITQCMHQTSLSEDYIVLIDAAFKLSLDVLMNNPFPRNTKIDAFLRKYTTLPQIPYTPVYIIKRSDLIAERDTVVAKKVDLKPEFIHFTANYANPEGLLTLYTASNSAACLAEWVRFYDELFPNTPIVDGTAGILATGSMDVNRVGKIVIDVEQASIKEENLIHKTGEPEKGEDMGMHTWLAGFYTFRGIISADAPVREIKQIYWQFGGLERRRLTKFIFDLYKDYDNRIVPTELVKQYSEQGVPLQITRLNTETMQLEDYYQFPIDYNLGAIQFVPKKTPTPDVEPQMDGYLFTTMLIPTGGQEDNYLREIWIFDACDLKKGAICKLQHPSFNFGFTLHSLWVADIDKISQNQTITKEYDELLDNVEPKFQKHLKNLFHSHVYPKYQ
ncbi:MAG: carotenoid oxygenase family protein [Bernardetiaceae bacterium]|nr:carotenoid oxygenase family protein [Bernardetiaceae bacterium]